MFRLIRRLHNSSRLDNIVLIFFSIIVLRIFSFIMCLQDLTFRLPRDVVPVSYVLQLHPDFRTELFIGEVVIAIEILGEKRYIALHSKDLTIRSAKLSRLSQTNETSVVIDNVELQNIFMVDEFEMLIVKATTTIPVGQYKLRFSFNGTMSKTRRGIFMVNYRDPYTGQFRKIATTRFEPTHARRAFPCFDEPRFKAVFDISLVQPANSGYNSLSNMPAQVLQPRTPQRGLTTVYFQQSLPISTYLIAFLVSDFVNRTAMIARRWDEHHLGRDSNGRIQSLIPLTAWTSLEKTISLDLALHMTYRSLDLYMRIFHMNYPLPKIDVVAIPGFSLGPMENWGLVLYEEPSVLYFPRSNSVNDLKATTNRIANGLIHMWFGNLVTMRWWNDAWLPKCFAMYMQYYTTNWGFPDWKEVHDFPESAIESFLVDVKYPSMRRDALICSLPIVQRINSPKEIDEFVNSISQKKGASILRMLHHVMGERNFFYGVSHYLQVYRFNTAATSDFIVSLQRFHSGEENLIQLLDTWTRQPGFPVLNIERINNTYYIHQSRFTCNNLTSYNEFDSPYLYKWDLPIFYTSSIMNGTKRIFLPYTNRKIHLLVDNQVTWVKFNAKSIGYYTVNYDLQTWEVFLEILQNKPEDLGIVDRIDLINDAFVNAEAGRIPYHIPLSMTESVRFEGSYTSWKLLSDKLLNIHMLLRDTEIAEDFKTFVINMMRSIYSFVTWNIRPTDSFERRRLRIILFKMACVLGMEQCIDEVTQRFRDWVSTPNIRPNPDIKEIIYYHGMINAGNEGDWNLIYGLFLAEPDIQERHRLMICLTAIQNPTILINYLEIAKNSLVMSNEEYLATFHAATLNPLDPKIVWDFYKLNWQFLASRYTDDDREFARLIISVTSKLRESHQYYEMTQFFDEVPCNTMNTEARKEASEILRNNLIWMQRNYREIKKWLDICKKRKNHP